MPDTLQKAIALHQAGNIQEAETLYHEVLAQHKNQVDALYLLGTIYYQQGKLPEAILLLERAVLLIPKHADACNTLANALQDNGQFDRAEQFYRQSIGHNPSDPCAHNNLGTLYNLMNRRQEAKECFEKAMALAPHYPEAINNLANLLVEQQQYPEALTLYQKAVVLAPDWPEAHNNLGIALQKTGQFEKALKAHEKALQLNPRFGFAKWLYHLSLPILYETPKDIDQHRKRFTDGLEHLIANTDLADPTQAAMAYYGTSRVVNFYLQYQGRNDLDLQRRYGEFVNRIMAARFPQWVRPRALPKRHEKGRIRLGYVSSFMHQHTVGKFLLGWLEHHDHQSFEIYCYYINSKCDALTDRVKKGADHFCQIYGNIEAMASRIDKDDLDILVFTDVGMFAPSTQLAALRLAPVQCKGWGHPVTTGLPTMDYYLSSDLMEPPDAHSYYAEKLVRLPNIALAYQKLPKPHIQQTRSYYGLKDNAFVYVSPQSLFKYLPQHDFVYPQIAKQVPGCQFCFVSDTSKHVTQQFINRLSRAFITAGVSFEACCVFVPRLAESDFLNLYAVSDVLLDSIDWSGGNTSLEGLGYGLPLVTLPGQFMRGRHAFAMLKMMGVEDTIATSLDDYIRIAVRLAHDQAWRNNIKTSLQTNQHKLYNDVGMVRALELFYKGVLLQTD